MNKATEKILDILESLDITPTMYNNATIKYENVSNYLEKHNIKADFYPQGSFSQGTVVRPFSEDDNAFYDLDVVCQVNLNASATTPKKLKHSVGNALKETETYSRLLAEEYESCWTLEYADVDDCGFNLDIVPAIPLDINEIYRLQLNNEEGNNYKTAIDITRKSSKNNYDWVHSNPKGLSEWFLAKNAPFYNLVAFEQKQRYFNSQSTIRFSSIEEVPDFIVKTTLQRAVQYLKRHRDVFYNRSSKEQLKPSSTVLTVLLGKYSESETPGIELLDLLKNFTNFMINNRIIDEANPYLQNPSQLKENLLDNWDSTTVRTLNQWLNVLKQEFSWSSLDMDSAELTFVSALKADKLNLRSMSGASKTPNIELPSKPWKK